MNLLNLRSFILSLVIGIKVEANCRCVDYLRDWYIVVGSQVAGIIQGILIIFFMKCLCKYWLRRQPQATNVTRTSQEEMGRIYEEIGPVTTNLDSLESLDIAPRDSDNLSNFQARSPFIIELTKSKCDSIDNQDEFGEAGTSHGKMLKKNDNPVCYQESSTEVSQQSDFLNKQKLDVLSSKNSHQIQGGEYKDPREKNDYGNLNLLQIRSANSPSNVPSNTSYDVATNSATEHQHEIKKFPDMDEESFSTEQPTNITERFCKDLSLKNRQLSSSRQIPLKPPRARSYDNFHRCKSQRQEKHNKTSFLNPLDKTGSQTLAIENGSHLNASSLSPRKEEKDFKLPIVDAKFFVEKQDDDKKSSQVISRSASLPFTGQVKYFYTSRSSNVKDSSNVNVFDRNPYKEEDTPPALPPRLRSFRQMSSLPQQHRRDTDDLSYQYEHMNPR